MNDSMPTIRQRRTLSLIVPKNEGEHLRRRLDDLDLRDKTLKIRRDGNNLLLPLKREAKRSTVSEALRKSRLRFAVGMFDVAAKEPKKSLQSLLAGLSPSKMDLLPRSYDVIGDIAIVELSPDLIDEASRIGEALLVMHKRLKAIYRKAGPITGDHRLRQLTHIAGKERAETIHRENGCHFKLNVTTCFFNPRLGGERLRVARQVSKGEKVLDMFAGVGPFSILIAKNIRAKVYAIDSNPEAFRYMQQNIHLNHVEDKVTAFEGDARSLTKNLLGKADRIIMNLPESSPKFLGAACEALKPSGGIMHFYTFQKEPGAVSKAEKLFASRVRKSGRSVEEIMYSRAIREIAPRTYQVVVDAKVV